LLDSSYTGAINIGTGEPVTIAEVARSAARAAGTPELLELGALPARAGEPDVLLADTTLLRSIGFTPRWTLDDAMDVTAGWWRDHLRKE
jgi:nucleoside-diphosphate-sugar epimerase